MDRYLVQIEAPHFTAGLISNNERVISASPILMWTTKYTIADLKDYFNHKGWKWKLIDEWKEGKK